MNYTGISEDPKESESHNVCVIAEESASRVDEVGEAADGPNVRETIRTQFW